jgi:thiol:disulfide interchange protein DsbC
LNTLTRITLAACTTVAALPAVGQLASTITKEALAARFPEVNVRDIADGPVPGFYEVVSGTSVVYITTDGRFLLRGDIVDLDSRTNLTDARRAQSRATLLATIDPAKEIVFAPPSGEAKHRIFVFTDVDCGYCRQFHRQIADVNALGIEVHYVSYPRTGPNTASWTRAENVWCSPDRKTALTEAKLGKEIAPVAGCSAPIAEEYGLGQRIGLTGTPGVYSESGVDLGGYVPAQQLLERLDALARK